MTNDEIDQQLITRRLTDLPLLTPDGRRAERVRARCRARLQRVRKHTKVSSGRPVPSIVGRVLIGALSAIYLSAALNYLLEVRSLL